MASHRGGDGAVVKALLEGGADANVVDDLGHNGLHKAARFNNPGVFHVSEISNLLSIVIGILLRVKCIVLSLGLIKSAAACKGENLECRSCFFVDHAILQLLLDAGADPGHVDNDGLTPLSILGRRDHGLAAVVVIEVNKTAARLLPSIRDASGSTIMHEAAGSDEGVDVGNSTCLVSPEKKNKQIIFKRSSACSWLASPRRWWRRCSARGTGPGISRCT